MDATTSQGSGALFPMPQQQIPAAQLFPPPPRPSLSSLSLTSSYSHHHAPPSITNFPILVLTVLGILTTSLLLLAYYVFVIRCCLNWHNHRGNSSSSSSSTNIPGARGRRQRARARAATPSSTALPVSAAAKPRGLDEAAIRALPAFRYTARKKQDAATKTPAPSECAVCLGEFEYGDRVRLLPGCLHVFHVACIDTWLHGNANCPLCRADIAGHCLLQLSLPVLPPLPADQVDDQEVAIQLDLVPGGAEQEDHQATTQAQQREAATAAAPETAGEAAAADNQLVVVVGGQRQSIVSACCHENEIDLGSKVDECTAAESKDGDVVPLPPQRRTSSSSSTGTTAGAGGEVHLQIHQSILQGNDTGSHRDDIDEHDSDTSTSVFSLV